MASTQITFNDKVENNGATVEGQGRAVDWNEVKNVVNSNALSLALIEDEYDTRLAGTLNTTAFTPTADYHPATKKYVDDNGGGGTSLSIAIIEDQKPSGTNGGTFTSGARRTRDLNTITSDIDSIVTLNANQFTLQAGTYLIEANATAIGVSSHQCFLQNITDATTDIVGKNLYADEASADCNESSLVGVITLTSTKTFELQHECKVTKSGNGYGGNTDTFSYNVYSQVKITKTA